MQALLFTARAFFFFTPCAGLLFAASLGLGFQAETLFLLQLQARFFFKARALCIFFAAGLLGSLFLSNALGLASSPGDRGHRLDGAGPGQQLEQHSTLRGQLGGGGKGLEATQEFVLVVGEAPDLEAIERTRPKVGSLGRARAERLESDPHHLRPREAISAVDVTRFEAHRVGDGEHGANGGQRALSPLLSAGDAQLAERLGVDQAGLAPGPDRIELRGAHVLRGQQCLERRLKPELQLEVDQISILKRQARLAAVGHARHPAGGALRVGFEKGFCDQRVRHAAATLPPELPKRLVSGDSHRS